MADQNKTIDIELLKQWQSISGEINLDMIQSTQYIAELNKAIKQGSQIIDDIPETVLRIALHAQGFSKTIGNANSQIFNHTKHLSVLGREYVKLQGVGKNWLSSFRFDDLIEHQKQTINQYGGIFLQGFTKANRMALDLAQNVNNIGLSDFTSIGVSQLSEIDSEIKSIRSTINELKSVDVKIRLNEDLASQIKDLQRLDPEDDMEILQYIRTQDKIKSLQQQIKNFDINIKQNEEYAKGMQQQLNLLISQKNHLYDMSKLQSSLNAKFAQPFQKLSQRSQKLNQIKDGLEGMFTMVNLAIPGLGQSLKKIDFSKLFDENVKRQVIKNIIVIGEKMGKINQNNVDESTIAWEKVKLIGQGTIKAIASVADKKLKIVMGAVIAAAGVMLKITFDRFIQVQDKILGLYSSSGLLVGQIGDMNQLWQAAGGYITNIDISDLIGEIHSVNDISAQILENMYKLQRQYNFTSSQTAKYIMDLKYMKRLTNQQTMAIAESVGQMAKLAGMIPRQIMTQLSSASQGVYTWLSNVPEQLAKSAIFAKKLGLSLDNIASFSQGLWDFESKMSGAMQIQALTGTTIPIDQIIKMNLQGDSMGALGLTIQSMGKDFEKQSPIIKKAIADFTGLSVTEFQKASQHIQAYGGNYKNLAQDLQSGNLGLSDDQIKAQDLLNTFDKLSQVFKTKIYTALRPVVKSLQEFVANEQNMGKLVESVEMFATSLSKLFSSLSSNKSILHLILNSVTKLFNMMNSFINVLNKIGPLASAGVLILLSYLKHLLGLNSIMGKIITTSKLMGASRLGKYFINLSKSIWSAITNLKIYEKTQDRINSKDIAKKSVAFIKDKDVTILGKKDITKSGKSIIDKSPTITKTKDITKSGRSIASTQKQVVGSRDITKQGLDRTSNQQLEKTTGGLKSASRIDATKLLQVGIATLAFATSIVLLAGALWMISKIEPQRLWQSVGALGTLAGVMVASMLLLTTFAGPAVIATGVMLGFGVAMVLISTSALIFSHSLNIVKDTLLQLTQKLDARKLILLGDGLSTFSSTLMTSSISLMRGSLLLLPASIMLFGALSYLNLSVRKLDTSGPSFLSFSQGLSSFTNSIVQFGQKFSDGSIIAGVKSLRKTVKQINDLVVDNKKLNLNANIQTNTISRIKTKFNKQDEDKVSKDNKLFLEELRSIAQKPIQLIINLDGKKVAQRIIKHSDVSTIIG